MPIEGIITDDRPIRGNMTPPPNSRMTGELFQGVPVYVVTEPVIKRRIRKDEFGEVEYWMNELGGKGRAKHELYQDGTIDREFILIDLGNGLVQKHYSFRGSPEEQLAEKRKEAEAKRLSRLLKLDEVLDAAGIAPHDLARSVRAETRRLERRAARQRARGETKVETKAETKAETKVETK